MTKLTALFLISLTTAVLSSEPVPFTINTKKWSHVLHDHFISITVNPTDLLQGRVYGLQMNSTMAILRGLAPAYVRIGSADTAKYTFKRNRYPSDVVRPDDEYTVTETHWIVFNEVAQQAGLDVIVCLNAAHRSEGTKKWDTRNTLELISFSDSQSYNLTWQLGYEVQGGEGLSGLQFGKDLNRLRTILNAFPRYQHAKLIGPDIRIIHKKEDIDFWNDVLIEAGPTLDAVTWHPRWPQPSKMKVSDNSDLGYEFPIDYLEWDRAQLNKILQKSIFKNPVWIGETKRESTGTFAEGLIWARRLALAAKLGIEVVMKQPNLMDITHPKPEYWIALLHKRLLGKSVLETKSVGNNTDLTVISHCTNPLYWSDKPEKIQDGPITVYGVNMGGQEQKIQIKGTWAGKSQLLFQYVLTSGSDPDSVFSQMTYLNGEPLMMTDDGLLPDIIPKIKKLEKGPLMKLPPYSVGFWVVPEAKVKICQVQHQNIPTINIETLTPSNVFKSPSKTLENIRDINQFIVEKLKNPESESEEIPDVKIETISSESSEKDVSMLSKENNLPRVARKIRQVSGLDLNQQIKTIMQETQEFLSTPEGMNALNLQTKVPKAAQTMEHRIQGLAEGISDAIKSTNQEQEFNKFLEDSGLKQDFGSLIINDRRLNAPGMKNFQPYFHSQNLDGRLDEFEVKERLRRSITESEEFSQEESIENEEELKAIAPKKPNQKISLVLEDNEQNNKKQDLFVPHQPDLKALEERYKLIVQSKLQDGKRKLDDIKKKIKQDDPVTAQMVKQSETVNENGLQEEIIKKEIELIEKTEETVADILKSQKKRQETLEDRIFDELSDVKEERIRELNDIYKNQRKKENDIVKRQVQTPLSKPLIKTVEYIEKNFNLDPESVRKIKRSLEERMGEILRNYDTKKSLEVKKRIAPSKEDRKTILKKSVKEKDKKSELTETNENGKDGAKVLIKERPKDKNIIRKNSNAQLHHKSTKKSGEETMHRSRKSEETKKKYQDDYDSFELFNQKKMAEPIKKFEWRRSGEISDEKSTSEKTPAKTTEKNIKPSKDLEEKNEPKKIEEETKEAKVEKNQEIEEKPKTEPVVEQKPLKNDKERREHMLKQITLMVDKMNSGERDQDGSTKINEDDISEEFETIIRPRGVRRRPRKAEISEELVEKVENTKEEGSVTEAPVKPTTPATKQSKLRKHRVRPNRKPKETKKISKEEEEESLPKKRHLPGFERPILDQKKFIKPKLKKLTPKFHIHGNELLINEKPPTNHKNIPTQPDEISVQQKEVSTATTEITMTPILNPNEELKKDLEDIVEEKIFLEQGSEVSKEKSETNGKEFLQQIEMEGGTFGETTTPNEGYIIVEPTEEIDSEELEMTEKRGEALDALSDNTAEEVTKKFQKFNITPETFERTSEVKKNQVVQSTSAEKDLDALNGNTAEEVTEKVQKINSKPETSEEKSKFKKNQFVQSASIKKEVNSSEVLAVAETNNEDPHPIKKNSSEVSNDDSNSSIESKIEESVEETISEKTEIENSQRKRRATFLPNHGEEEDEDDFSSEERIQKFKQMIYRKSPTKKPIKNELRATSGMGMGADEFLRMAGSTVRVMFDDVIPEAYGQTKNKIQNMGITEYIKEFGKIVQQMKNLDQIFLNIGEAAVKGYIKGNKAEKGPYIQVISRKKRGIKKDDDSVPEFETKTSEEPGVTHDVLDHTESGMDLLQTKLLDDDDSMNGSIEYATPSTGKASAATGQRNDRENAWDISTPGREFGKGIYENDKAWNVETTESIQKEEVEASKTLQNVEQETKPEASFLRNLQDKETSNQEPTSHPKTLSNNIKVQQKKKTELHTIVNESSISEKINPYMPTDLQEKIFTPWIKTTKDFIRQALTTLERQRELSEILANDLMNRDLKNKAVGKREATDGIPRLPVYHMIPPAANKKRDTQQTHSDESLIRHLRGLQPGVYVVPTEEMTNIRSEQITNEAKQKSGMPNVVTLNIYYDKKSSEVSGKTDLTRQTKPKSTQDAVTYYQNKAWNAAASQYDQSTQYLTLPEMNLPTPVVSSVQVNPALQTQAVYAAEPRIAELPNSRLIQYPSPTFHYPPIQKMYPAIVPNPHPVYGPVYYLPQESRFASQPPGTKRQWREFKSRSSAVPLNSGWNIQYDVPGSITGSSKTIIPSSYNKNYKFLTQDKKRSVGDFKVDPTWSESALPFWKFFATSEKKNRKVETESTEKQENPSVETDSSEDVFAENRKRAKAAVEKVKAYSAEQVTEEKIPEEEEERAVEETTAEDGAVEEEKSRKRRSVTNNLLPEPKTRRLYKRSFPYDVEFKDHDILPEWFGTYQEIENSLDNFPPHVRRSHIISTPWSEEDEELLSILENENELSVVDFDSDDYFYSNDNTIHNLRRYPRSTDQLDSNMIKSNVIYKMPMNGDHLKPKHLRMTGIKKLTGEDSSLEMVTKPKNVEIKTKTFDTTKNQEKHKQQQEVQHTLAQVALPAAQASVFGLLPSQNGTFILPRNPHDGTFYYFFKYAYDSLVKVMRSMANFF